MSDEHAKAADRAIDKLAEEAGASGEIRDVLAELPGTSEAWLREHERPVREAYEARLREDETVNAADWVEQHLNLADSGDPFRLEPFQRRVVEALQSGEPMRTCLPKTGAP